MTKAQQKRLVNWRLRVLRHERDATQNISRTCRHFGVSRHVYIRPRTPRLNGKVERSHRADDQEFYQLLDKKGITDDIRLFNAKLREWEDYYRLPARRSAWTCGVAGVAGGPPSVGRGGRSR